MTIETVTLSPTLRIRIEYDHDCPNPRVDYDNIGKIIYSSSRYRLGDENVSVDELDRVSREIREGRLIGWRVFAYIHSGTTLRVGETNPFSCPWDSGQCGFIYCTPEQAVKEWGRKRLTKGVRAKALEHLKNEIEAFDLYLRGECYGYVIERLTLDDDGEVTETEELDAGRGFLGDTSYCLEQARDVARAYEIKEDELVPA